MWNACKEDGWGTFEYVDKNFGNNPIYPRYISSKKYDLSQNMDEIEVEYDISSMSINYN